MVYGEHVSPKVEYRSSRNGRRLMDKRILLGYGEHVPPKFEYRSSRKAVVSWTRECRELVSRAVRLVSLSTDYSIRRAFDFE